MIDLIALIIAMILNFLFKEKIKKIALEYVLPFMTLYLLIKSVLYVTNKISKNWSSNCKSKFSEFLWIPMF